MNSEVSGTGWMPRGHGCARRDEGAWGLLRSEVDLYAAIRRDVRTGMSMRVVMRKCCVGPGGAAEGGEAAGEDGHAVVVAQKDVLAQKSSGPALLLTDGIRRERQPNGVLRQRFGTWSGGGEGCGCAGTGCCCPASWCRPGRCRRPVWQVSGVCTRRWPVPCTGPDPALALVPALAGLLVVLEGRPVSGQVAPARKAVPRSSRRRRCVFWPAHVWTLVQGCRRLLSVTGSTVRSVLPVSGAGSSQERRPGVGVGPGKGRSCGAGSWVTGEKRARSCSGRSGRTARW